MMGYDSPWAHPVPSFNTPLTPPSSEPDEGDLISVCFSKDWQQVVIGALMALTLQSTWNGTPDEIAQAQGRAQQLMALFWTSRCDVPGPYWESDEDNESGEAPADDQSWYGIISSEVWYEQISDWVIAGFLAIAVSPDAAIQYVMYVPRARLAFRTHDLGSLVTIFLDGTEIFSGDTYSASPGVMEVDVMGEDVMGYAPPYTMQVRKASNSELQVIRKRLDPNEVYPTDIRYDPGTNSIQKTYDGGTTWVDYPQGDPRSSTVFQRPPRGTGDVRCDTAANMVKWIQDFINQMITTMQQVSLITTVANEILDFLDLLSEGFAEIFNAVLTVAGDLLTLGYGALETAFTQSTYDTLLCIFFCHMETDGTITDTEYTDIQSAISAQLNTTAATVMGWILGIQGKVGLINAGAIGSAVGDCTACTCGYCTSDWSLLDVSALCPSGFTGTTAVNISTNTGNEIVGSLGNGNPSTASDPLMFARFPIPSGWRVTEVHATIEAVANRSPGGGQACIYRSGSTTPLASNYNFPLNTPETVQLDATGLSITDPYIYFQCNTRGALPEAGQYANLTAFQICLELA